MGKNSLWKISLVLGILCITLIQCTSSPVERNDPYVYESDKQMTSPSTSQPTPTGFVAPTSVLDEQLSDNTVFVDIKLSDIVAYLPDDITSPDHRTYNSIFISHDRNIWVGGSDYIALFDGSDWEISIIPTEQLPAEFSYYITSVSVDSLNSVWVAGAPMLYRFKDNAWAREFDQINVNEIKINPVDGFLWIILNHYGGVMKFDGENWVAYTAENGLLSNQVFDVDFDASGTAWFVTSGGISSFDGMEWQSYPLALFCSSPSCYTESLFANITVNSDGTVWFELHGAGLFHYTALGQWERYTNNLVFQDYFPISNMCFTPDGKLWMGKWSKHSATLLYFEDKQWHILRARGMSEDYDLPLGRINDIACANDNSIWFVSASNAGVFHYIPEPAQK